MSSPMYDDGPDVLTSYSSGASQEFDSAQDGYYDGFGQEEGAQYQYQQPGYSTSR